MKSENVDFFEGITYKGEFKGLMPKYYPKKYKKYIVEETELLKEKVNGSDKILEAGVGTGRLIPVLAPLVKEFVGIDTAQYMIDESNEMAKDFPNVKIIKEKIENLGSTYPPNYFDYSLCIWNTLGNLKTQVIALKELAKVTSKSILVTVFLKGTIKDRLEFYKAVNVEILDYDKEKESFHLKGYNSKTFSPEDLKNLAKEAGLTLKETKILGGVILWGEITKKEK